MFQNDNAASRTVWHAIGLGVGRFVVSADRQIMTWSAMARRPQRVLVDITDEPADDLVEAVLTREQLDFLGVRRQLSAADDAENVARAIGQLGPVLDGRATLSHLNLAVSKPPGRPPVSPQVVAAAIDKTLNDGCGYCGLPLARIVVSSRLAGADDVTGAPAHRTVDAFAPLRYWNQAQRPTPRG